MPFDNVPVKKPLSPGIEADLRVLRLTREHIATGGWCKVKFSTIDDHHCVVGWLRHVAMSSERADRIAAVYLAPLTPLLKAPMLGARMWQDPLTRVFSFNDTPATTRYDVVDLIDRAIAKVEEYADAV